MVSQRSAVGDIPAIIASIVPEVKAGTKPSHSVLTITNSFPKPSAILLQSLHHNHQQIQHYLL